MRVEKKFFNIGVYDPAVDEIWPWSFHVPEGVFLSINHRLCKINKAAEFHTEKAAREFFHGWKKSNKYKFELVGITRWEEIPDPEFPDWHPRTKYKVIQQNENSRIANTALLWLTGNDPRQLMSGSTFKKHRDVLLKYEVDISDLSLNIYGEVPIRAYDESKTNSMSVVSNTD